MEDAYVCPMSKYVKYVHDCPLAFGLKMYITYLLSLDRMLSKVVQVYIYAG